MNNRRKCGRARVLMGSMLTLAGFVAQAGLAWMLPEPGAVTLGGAWGAAYRQGAERLGQDPYCSAAYLRSDFSFETNRIFVNYSGDISGRFIEIASLLSPPGRMTPPTLPEVLLNIGQYQRADGHFGRAVDWSDPLEAENPNAKLLPICWGNSRLMVGLLEAYQAFGRAEWLAIARRMGDFYIATADRFLDPQRMAEYRFTGSYAAGYVTDYFPGIEGLVRLYTTTGDARYLHQAERMAAFFRPFDTLPIDHSHANLLTHHALLLLYEATGRAEYLDRPLRRWHEARDGGYVWPLGGVGEKFRVNDTQDEGCSEADWLRLSLRLWKHTGDTRCLDAAERLLWNHYAMNRTPNGGYGHHNFLVDSDGPWAMKPECTEAVWCCTFHGLLGLHTLKAYLAAGHPRGVYLNFPADFETTVSARGAHWLVRSACECSENTARWRVRVEPTSRDSKRCAVFVRMPDWADAVSVIDARGTKLRTKREGGYLRLPPGAADGNEIVLTFSFAPRVENRRGERLVLRADALARHPAVTLMHGPRLLLADVPGPRPALVGVVGKDGRLRIPRATDGRFELVRLSSLNVNSDAFALAGKPTHKPTLSLSDWDQARRNATNAFVFDLMTVPDQHPLAERLRP